ncbi:hypothetical protein E8E13_005205 [Curvularia kusanoi]|uniref:Uncharacterized protein n=1 Tax=Curvularia kusanoi TaxID=90978 RepID=A0A9P4T780_CURKU|nr:hypothetical protein E8E13_005205 [Curvularia kusanoi]
MLALKLALVAATGVLGAALPEHTAAAHLDLRGVDCGSNNAAFNELKKLGPPGTSFCRSYLKMPATSTRVTTVTAATVTKTTSTKTVTVTSSSCPKQKREALGPGLRYVLEFTHEFSRITPDDLTREVQKRNDYLPQLQGYGAAKISQGCGCICMKPTATQVVTSTVCAKLDVSFQLDPRVQLNSSVQLDTSVKLDSST